jgi:hypothetical protein
MALISIDPFQWIDAWRRTTKLFEWARLWASLTFTGIVSFAFTCGSALMTGEAKAFAIGSGLASAAVMMTVVWRTSPLTKGTTVALPAAEAKAELEVNQQVITK